MSFLKIAEPGLDAVKASVQLLELMEHGGVIGHTNYSNILIMLWNLFFLHFSRFSRRTSEPKNLARFTASLTFWLRNMRSEPRRWHEFTVALVP